MSDPIWQWTATRTARAIRTREISAETVAEAHVARMRAANPALNAVVVDLGDEAVDTARGVDQALVRCRIATTGLTVVLGTKVLLTRHRHLVD